MDINKIQQQLVQALEQKNADQLTTLSRILNLIVGKPTSVEVLSAEPMAPAEQHKLQQQTAAALSQVREQIRNVAAKIDPKTAEMDDHALSQDIRIPPALRALFTRLLNQQELLASPKLQWVEISQNDQKTPVYTNQNLVAGQKILIQLTNPQRLSFTSTNNTGQANLADDETQSSQVILNSQKLLMSTLANSPNALSDLLKKPGLSNLLQGAEQQESAATQLNNSLTPNQTSIKAALALTGYKQLLANDSLNGSEKNGQLNSIQNKLTPEAVQQSTDKLRDLLGLNLRPSTLYSLVNRLAQQPALFDQPETKSLEQILKSVAEKIRTPEFFQRPDSVKNTVRQSGIFYESKLDQFARNNASTNSNPTLNKNAPLNMNLENQIPSKLQNLVSNDTKGNLLNLVRTVGNVIAQNKLNLKSSNSTQPTNSTSIDDLQALIKDLVKQSGILLDPNSKDPFSTQKSSASAVEQLNKLIEQLHTKDLPNATRDKILNEVVKLVQQEAAHSLTKIQIQQFQSLLQRNDSELGGKHQTQSWQLEIPVRHHNEIHPVQVDIERHWLNPEDSNEKSYESTKTKQWNITLRFDLPLMGEFCAQLIMQGENLTAKLWADRENTLKRIQRELDGLKKQMESDGIVVKSLQCANGLPAKKQIRLSYSLIDVST